MNVRQQEGPSCRSLLWSSLQVAVGALLLFLVACWRVGGELPTRMPTAEVPPTEIAGFSAYEGTLPPTFTPYASPTQGTALPTYVATPAATATLPPAVGIPVAQPPPTVVPTPFDPPAYLLQTVQVHQYNSPRS